MLKAGTASTIINNEIGTEVQAAGHAERVKYIRDDLEANVLWIESGETALLFITCDLIGFDRSYVQRLLPEVAAAASIPEDCVMIGCSHTHSGPSICGPSHPEKSIETAYLERLSTWLCEAARSAVTSAEEVEIAWGKGQAEIGYNRRVCFADGTRVMHGDPGQDDATGLEGFNDPQHTALFVRTTDGKMLAVLYNNTAHPINFYGADFLSADYPGLARTYLREVFGDISVLFFNGTLGDNSVMDEHWRRRTPETPEQRLARAAHLVTGETLRLLQHADFRNSTTLAHQCTHFEADLRAMPDNHLEWAQKTMQAYREGKRDQKMLVYAKANSTLLFHEQFTGQRTETVDIHAGRIGDMAFVTAPCEMFTHFGQQVKRRSPFPITAVFGLTNGTTGYCPTIEGIMGGSWEGTFSLGSRWDVMTGYRMVDEWSRMLFEMR